MSEILTEKQEALLQFIEQYQLEHGGSPTLREMREYFGVSSDNSILKHLKALEEKGKIEKDEKHRGIKLLSNVKEKLEKNDFKLPLLGSIRAGAPVAAEEQVEGYVSVGEDLVLANKQSFMLRVNGNSMMNAGILDGDMVIVCTDLTPKVGDVVVALVDGQSTVKTYMVNQGQVYLKPENPEYENIYPENDLCIQGVVTGLFRYYKR
jgi:repressor LexA